MTKEAKLQAKKERRKARRKARRVEERSGRLGTGSSTGMGSVPSSATSSSFKSQTSLSGASGSGVMSVGGHRRHDSASTSASGNSAQFSASTSSEWTDIASGGVSSNGSQNYGSVGIGIGSSTSRKMSTSSSIRSGGKTESIRPEDSASRRASFNTGVTGGMHHGLRIPAAIGSPFSPTTLTDTATTTSSKLYSPIASTSQGFPRGGPAAGGGRRLLEEDEESVSSYDEASSSLDAFFANEGEFLMDEGNKLKVWQGLCLELGLAVLPDKSLKAAANNSKQFKPSSSDSTYSTPPSTPRGRSSSLASDEGSPFRGRRRSSSADSHKTINENDISRAATPTNPNVILPETLRGCKELLKSRGHVNIKDYMEERDRVREKRRLLIAEKVRKGKEEGEYERLTAEEEEDLRADLRDLVYPNATMMAKYTRSSRRLAKKKLVKEDWLQPLMRYIYYTRPHNYYDEDLD